MNKPLHELQHLAAQYGSGEALALLDRLLLCSERLSDLLDHCRDAVILYNPDSGLIVDCNACAERLLGRSREQLLTARFEDCVFNSSHTSADDASAFIDGGDGGSIPVTLHQSPQALGKESLIQVILLPDGECLERLDEAERRARELRVKTERLEEAERARVEFLALISHELRTPLNAIIGYNSLLEEQVYGELNLKQTKAIQRIDRNASRLLALINQLLELSRLEAGAASVFEESFDLKKAVAEVLDDYQVVAEEKGLEILALQPHREVMVYTDLSKLQEMVRQIVSNALKFTHEGSVTVSIKPVEAAAILEISDEGPGIEAEKREAIYELFQQVDSTRTKRPEGAGLGLAIVRRLADLLNLRVELESKPGQGALFRLSVPLAPAPEASVAAPPAETADSQEIEVDAGDYRGAASGSALPSTLPSTLPSILVVDDDPYAVEVLSEFLENRGHYRVAKAYSGMHAMLHLAKSRPDYLLADLLMPNINGERLIEYCTQLWGDQVKIIVITGKTLTQEERERLERRVAAIVLKGDLRGSDVFSALESVIPIPAATSSSTAG